MKRILLGCLMVLFLCGTAWGQRITVTKDSAGTMTGVTAYVTASGVTVWEATATGVSVYATTWNNMTEEVVASPNGYVAIFNSDSKVSGYPTLSGVSIADNTITDAKITGTLTKEIATTETITGRSKHINLTSSSLVTLDLSGTSSVWVSAVSDTARAPTSGVSVQLESPDAAGYDVVFIMENSSYDAGTTTYLHFPSGDNIASADTITAGVSKYIMSGTTDAQKIICHSTGTSIWYVTTTGSPTVDWD